MKADLHTPEIRPDGKRDVFDAARQAMLRALRDYATDAPALELALEIDATARAMRGIAELA